MTEDEQELVWCLGGTPGRTAISDEEFLKKFRGGTTDGIALGLTLLDEAIASRNSDDVSAALLVGAVFGRNRDWLNPLRSLLSQEWHHSHEEIVRELQDQPENESVPYLKNAIALKPNLHHLDYDDYGAFYKKCLWALRAIGTPEAIAAIEECAKSDNKILQKEARYRLKRIAEGG